mgnify:FL=1
MRKITLTLKQSSFLFIGSLNLTKGKPTIVDTDKLSVKETKILNRYIKSGGVESDVGLLPIEEVQLEEKTEAIVEDAGTGSTELEKPVQEELKEETVEKRTATPKQRTSTKKK